MGNEAFCPKCQRKLASYLQGVLQIKCPRCKEIVVLDKRITV